jgi:hypothetical protein
MCICLIEAFLYVANDVIQHDKRKGGDFVRDFLPMLPSAVQHIMSRVNDETIHRTVKRIIQIWNERDIYQTDAIKLLKTSYENGVRRITFILVVVFVEHTIVSCCELDSQAYSYIVNGFYDNFSCFSH